MTRRITVILIVAIIALAGMSALVLTRNPSDQGDMTGMDHGSNTESVTYKQFSALKGEDFDRLFLADMIAHHQGAIDMARLVLTQAKHDELKTMAQDIIQAQDKEITDMKTWQTSWGYLATHDNTMSDHSSMNMGNDMADMTSQLKGLNGDAFDRKFLEFMIEHHQGAIDMARPAATNAQHTEVKTLAKAIVDAQSKEVDQLRAWQTDWGYKAQ